MTKYNKTTDLIAVDELGQLLHPIFNTKIGLRLGQWLLKRLKVDALSQIHREHSHLRGFHFTEAVLSDPRIDVRYKVHGIEHLTPFSTGSFLTISNHPYGGIDGLILIDIVQRLRRDYKVLVNDFLARVTALQETWIPVRPVIEKKIERHNPLDNISGLRYLRKMIQQGHPVGMFPAGGISNYKTRHKPILEQAWQMNNVRLMTEAKVPIIPILFSGENSDTFYNLERISYTLNVLRIPAEILNKRGRVIDVFIGAPILPEMVDSKKTLKEKRSMLMEHAYTILQKGLKEKR